MSRLLEIGVIWTDDGDSRMSMALSGFVPELPEKVITIQLDMSPTLRRQADRIDSVRDQVLKQIDTGFHQAKKEIELYEFVSMHIEKARELVKALPLQSAPPCHKEDTSIPVIAGEAPD